MAYSVSFNLTPVMDPDFGNPGSDDTAQDSICQLLWVSKSSLECGSVSLGTQEMETALEDGSVSPGNQEIETALEDGSVSPGNQEIEMALEDGSVSPGNQEIETALEDGSVSPGNQEMETALKGGSVSPGNQEIETALEDGSVSPGNQEIETALEGGSVSPGNQEMETALEGGSVSPGNQEMETALEDGSVSPGNQEIETALEGGSVSPGNQEMETALEGGSVSPGSQEKEVLTKEDRLDKQVGIVMEQAAEETLQSREESKPLVRNRWSAATLKVLSCMPSRSIGCQSAIEVASKRTICHSQQHRYHLQTPNFSHSTRYSVRRNGIEVAPEDVNEEEDKRQELANNLQNMSSGERVRMLRSMPICLSEKRTLRKLAFSGQSGQSLLSREVPCNRLLNRDLRQCLFASLSLFSSLQLWRVPLKRLGCRFGTGVLSYFLFLRTLLLFNIFLFFINGLFLVLPQAIHPPLPQAIHPPNPVKSQLVLELFISLITGTGFLKYTVMFYGYYSNSTINTSWGGTSEPQVMAYNIPLAYFFSTGIAFFITGIVLIYSVSKSFGRSFPVFKSHGNLAIKLFCFWDFKVSKKTSVRIQSENISTQLKELLSEVNFREEERGRLERLCGMGFYLLAWTICLGSTFCWVLGIYSLTAKMGNTLPNEAHLLVVPGVVSCGNLFLPGLFNLVSWMENYSSPSVCLYVAIFRNLLLKFSILGVLCYHWLGRVAPQNGGVDTSGQHACWEDLVGQELYRFLLMDFIFTVLHTVFGEFLWKLFSQRVLQRRRKPVFDIARNVLELIYGQTLTWLGLLFTPLIPVVQIIRLLVLFHMKRSSLLMNCQASRKPWRSSHMTSVFISLLCFPSYLGVAVFVNYTLWTIKPSSGCGPFRNLPFMFHSGKQWAHELAKGNPNLDWLNWVHSNLVENPLFLFLVAGIFLMVIYVHAQVLDGQRRVMDLLQEQIKNEGKDMKFLITRLQDIHDRQPAPSPALPTGLQQQGSEVRNEHDVCGV
ncbi:hypothetical protein UPYG_G00108510 [Umbra pygmaea]|uniref:Transmembrane channel-like protein n=1 Tax=Umbra pygmaea TaxID=75934 RepID=A0ABD0XMN7_UMBPY